MAAVSLSIQHGVQGLKISDFTVGTLATTAGTDFEFRFNTTDQLSNAITRKDVIVALLAFIRAIEAGGNIVTNAPPL